MDDIRAVMDSCGSERAVLLRISEGGPMCNLFAATYPERTVALILYGTFAKGSWSEDYPWAPTPEDSEKYVQHIHADWGTTADEDLAVLAPSMVGDREYMEWLAKLFRLGASPGAGIALERMNIDIDIRHVLPATRVPTLVLHRTGDLACKIQEGRYVAERISGARFVELPGDDHIPYVGDGEAVLREIEAFATQAWEQVEPDRVLATIMFTDIVGSTEKAAELGDEGWKRLLEEHHARIRAQLGRFRGVEVDTAGDGFFATFDGPARAINCARAVVGSVADLGIRVRVGLHCGECERIAGKAGGVAVNIGARVSGAAGPNEILVSQTVKDLVAGSGLTFEDAGEHELKGVPDRWRLYRLVA